MEQSDLLNVREAADRLHLKASTIRSWIHKRRIPFVRLGRRVFVRRSDVDQLITDSIIAPTVKKSIEK
jgi:excisionase family DNA binding protein